MATLGWIGLGDIGAPMALRLQEAGHDLVVWGRRKDRLAPVLDKGGFEAPSPRAVAERCAAVFLCVTDTQAVEEVAFAPQGLAAAGKSDLLIVDHSTIHPGRTREMASRLAEAGAGRWVDAPVSGGAVGARNGTLAVMAGGDAADVERARPWIAAYGGRITHVGPSGSGQAAKACNQAIANTTLMAWAEILACASAYGLDLDRMCAAMEGGFADSAVRRHLVPMLRSGTFPGRYAPLIPKDLDIACDIGRAVQSPMPLTSLVVALYRQHQVLQRLTGAEQGLLALFAPPQRSQTERG